MPALSTRIAGWQRITPLAAVAIPALPNWSRAVADRGGPVPHNSGNTQ